MAQARRTGQRRKSQPKRKTKSSQQWGLLLVVLLSGMALGALLFGYGPFGKGLHNYAQQTRIQQETAPVATDATTQSPVRTEKEFQFYEILEDNIGRVLPDNFALEEPGRDKKKYLYIMQVASFNSSKGAQELKARLALKGFQSMVEEKSGKYRVKMGPYSDRRKLKNARTKVQKTGLGLRPIGIQYKKK